METSTAKELIAMLADRASAWQAYWTTFYTVSAAIVTLIASGKLLPKYRTVASIIATVGFLIFAVGNYQSLSTMRIQRNAVVEFVKEKAVNNPPIIEIAESSIAPTENELRLYHWGLSLFVVVLLIAIPSFQQSPKEN